VTAVCQCDGEIARNLLAGVSAERTDSYGLLGLEKCKLTTKQQDKDYLARSAESLTKRASLVVCGMVRHGAQLSHPENIG
jgi:hypothetical protein